MLLVKREDVDRVEHERWPHLKKEERLMPTVDFGLDRAKRQGIEQGARQEQLAVDHKLFFW